MTIIHLKSRHLLCLIFLLAGLGACSTNVRLATTGTAIFPMGIDLQVASESLLRIKQLDCTAEADFETYNCEVRKAMEQITQFPLKSGLRKKLLTTDGKIEYRINHSEIRCFEKFDRLVIADTITVLEGIEKKLYVKGAGIPMIGRLPRSEKDSLIPETGLWVPLTALLEPAADCVTIRLVDTDDPHCRKSFPIAANFTAPLARDFFDRQKEFESAKALLNYERFATQMGITRIFDFHPDKTPVVLVHGVFSTTNTWINMINQMMIDPEIRNHYEFWTFEFPTGGPIPYLAQNLRKEVVAMQEFRQANGAKNNAVIVVGHSMGGLLAKMLTQHSGAEQWDSLFEVAPEKLDVNEDERVVLREMFFFEPLPSVKQVVFMATPHCGSELVDEAAIRALNSLIRGPEIIVVAGQKLAEMGQRVLTPLGVTADEVFPTSLEQLRSDSELGAVFAKIPLNPSVKYHSLIASRDGLDVPKEDITDGVVTYSSAHLEGVVSEKIIKSDHSIQNTAEGTAEVARILKSVR